MRQVPDDKGTDRRLSPVVLVLIGLAITVVLFGLILWEAMSTYGTLTAIERDESALTRLEFDLTRLDETLSNTALLAVATTDSLWLNRYLDTESQLEHLIVRAAAVLDTTRTGSELIQMRTAHRQRVETELTAIHEALAGQRNSARQMLQGEPYQVRRGIYVGSIRAALNVLDDRQQLNTRLLRWRLLAVGALAVGALVIAWLRILQLQHLYLEARSQAAIEREGLIHALTVKNEELERFSYSVSHDLKSPLVTIGGFLKWVEREALAGNYDTMRQHLHRISGAVVKMEDFIETLLKFSRAGHVLASRSPVPMSDVANDAVELLGGRIGQKGARVIVQADLPVVLGDRQLLLEVLLNLVDNALKFTGDQLEPCVEIGVRPESEREVLFVSDNGIGIESHQKVRVFGLFEKLGVAGEGSGLGLALVKRIVERLDGDLWIESEGLGKGTTVCFVLPLARSSTRSAG